MTTDTATTKTLPPWQDAWSDGCSIPEWVKPFITQITPAIHDACVRHDEKYYYGGSREDRLRADYEWAIALLLTGDISIEGVEQWFAMVRIAGGPNGRNPKYSWAFGGKVFAYTPSRVKAVPELAR